MNLTPKALEMAYAIHSGLLSPTNGIKKIRNALGFLRRDNAKWAQDFLGYSCDDLPAHLSGCKLCFSTPLTAFDLGDPAQLAQAIAPTNLVWLDDAQQQSRGPQGRRRPRSTRNKVQALDSIRLCLAYLRKALEDPALIPIMEAYADIYRREFSLPSTTDIYPHEIPSEHSLDPFAS